MNSSKRFIYLPLVFALLLVLGIYIGYRYSFINNPTTTANNDKIAKLLSYIQKRYVDTVNQTQLEDKALNTLLQNLDPHSSYVTAKEAQAMNEPLQGNFGGIGIEFNIIKDTIRVVSAISGGPSEALGIQAGDMIVKIEGKSAAGVRITNQQVIGKLRGESGSKVNISVKRRGVKKLIDFSIIRGEIPIYSIDAAYMIDTKTGYIKVSRFGATTYDEYMKAFRDLRKKGLSSLILDLRGNPGGYLNAAVMLADEFLEAGKEIVHTQGRSERKKVHTATIKGEFEKNKLIILIDEGSASASEIVAGAIQDNDRGTIIGRRSFGKGLVQEEKEFDDGSAVRLTIARYYTPTGRCIQKSYEGGVEAYYSEEIDRYNTGELQNADSIKFNDSLKYKTPAGKIVYGGGGIMPDVFVPLDTTGRTIYLSEVTYSGLLTQFAFDYADRNRTQLKEYGTFERFNKTFIVSDQLLEEFILFAEKGKVKRRETEIKRSAAIIKIQLKALIARNTWNSRGYYPVVHSIDNAFRKAVELAQ
ncbi:MAG: S41 family peptidase [Bacteroidetes bacterium]|nr:S41 family peptidase [Bacteroidota bacterium]